MKREAILFFFGCSEVNSTWLITSEPANQRARKALFTCVVYTNYKYIYLPYVKTFRLHINCINWRDFFFFRVKEKMNPFTLRFLERDSEFQVNQNFTVQIIVWIGSDSHLDNLAYLPLETTLLGPIFVMRVTKTSIFIWRLRNTANWPLSKQGFRWSAPRDQIDQFQYIKIQPKTTDLSTRLWWITTEFVVFIPQSLVLRYIA